MRHSNEKFHRSLRRVFAALLLAGTAIAASTTKTIEVTYKDIKLFLFRKASAGR